MSKTKICSKCKNEKYTTEFYKDRHNPTGFCSACKLCRNLSHTIWVANNRDKTKGYDAKYIKTHSKQVEQTHKSYYNNHKEKCKSIQKIWESENKDRRRLIRLKHDKKRLSTIEGKLSNRISTAIRSALKGSKAGQHWETLVGWTLEDLKKDFENKYYDDMSYNSFGNGKIEIHHIVKRSYFNYKTAEDPEFKACWALSNLKPMWKKDHIALHKQIGY